MKHSNRFQLLRELLHLRERFGEKAFHELAEALRKETLIDDIISISRGLSEVTKKLGSGRPASRSYKVSEKERLGKEIGRLSSSKSQPDRELGHFMLLIFEGKVLKNLRLLRIFAAKIGYAQKQHPATRWALIRGIMSYLQKRSPTELKKYTDLANAIDQSPSELAGWTKIIVKGD